MISKIDIIHKVADKVNGTVRSDYSGRGMFGAKCYGIICENYHDCINEAAYMGLLGATYDNMGLDYIVYWPMIQGD